MLVEFNLPSDHKRQLKEEVTAGEMILMGHGRRAVDKMHSPESGMQKWINYMRREVDENGQRNRKMGRG